MKNCIWKGLCLFFMLLSLTALFVPIAFAAQDGHGGSTEVIARVEAPTEQTTTAQPFTEPVPPADNTPVQTGSSAFWIIASVICMITAWLLIVRARSEPSK
ncbi:MAG: hypothetical protein II082_01720 [Ruminococcus sp.]|jgi:hypothetical protein|nr:hypothetical protein [uncultured Ruminococcus sp.]MBQ1585971.1 hypothetical protein [Ruminococcus sp.]MDO4893199.1 hypothetical protein [Eubacteriales bacterium]MBQ1830441.1 hypothetical protein [Ruminococcus sp.]MBQ1921664.1 hypothetical protein [Ruminococcus sp.]MBQ2426973.1 hypothetical protein [Ruminococcus sp.]